MRFFQMLIQRCHLLLKAPSRSVSIETWYQIIIRFSQYKKEFRIKLWLRSSCGVNRARHWPSKHFSQFLARHCCKRLLASTHIAHIPCEKRRKVPFIESFCKRELPNLNPTLNLEGFVQRSYARLSISAYNVPHWMSE